MTTLASYAVSAVAFNLAPFGFSPVETSWGTVVFERKESGRLPFWIATPETGGFGPEYEWQEMHLIWGSERLEFENLKALMDYLSEALDPLPGFELVDCSDAAIPF